ncbi:MAG: GNAT family N-acetyltransferase [Spirosomataceae bacterium]
MKLLPDSHYDKVLPRLKQVAFNHLFARSVVEKHVTGKIWAEDLEDPRAFYIQHPYGMSLLFGQTDQTAFNQGLADYLLRAAKNSAEWLQAYPDEWNLVLRDLLGDRLLISENENDLKRCDAVIQQTRVNFCFNPHSFAQLRLGALPGNFSLVRTDAAIYHALTGSVIPSNFWDHSEDFLRRGIGFSLLHQGRAISTAFASFIHNRQLELGIETLKEYQGQGLAKYVCAALIDHCLNHGYEPVWSCRLANTGSYKLAQQLGFEPVRQIPYYRLTYTGLPNLLKPDAYSNPAKP